MDVELQNFQDINAWMNEAFSKERWADAILEDHIQMAEEKGRNEGYTSGVNDGYNSGRNDAVLETAKNMLKDNINIKSIMKYTGLTKKEIEKLK